MPRVTRKDTSAFEVFYERHGTAAYSLAHRIVGDPGTAEDVTQEAFLSIWRSEAGYDPARGSVRSWALGIVRNRAIDTLRRAASARIPKLELGGGALLEHEEAPGRTDAEAIRRDTARRLRGVLGGLLRDQSQVIELAYFGGFTHSQIAEVLGVPLGTVKGRMRLGTGEDPHRPRRGNLVTDVEHEPWAQDLAADASTMARSTRLGSRGDGRSCRPRSSYRIATGTRRRRFRRA